MNFVATLIIKQTLNNVFVSLMENGKTKCVRSSGLVGLSGPKKIGSFAFEKILRNLFEMVRDREINQISIVLKSPLNRGLKNSLKLVVGESKISILELRERIRISHNGLRPRKAKRL